MAKFIPQKIEQLLQTMVSPFQRKFKKIPRAVNPGNTVIAVPERIKKGHTLTEKGAWNPVLKYPRNEKCFCDSGKKFKNCCLISQPLAVDKTQFEKLKKAVKTIKQHGV